MSNSTISLFFSYSQKDEALRDELAKHLRILERQGTISSWHDRKILPGDEWSHQIDQNLNSADIILLLISPDFIASDYCWDIEVTVAMRRHEAGEACVIPVILRSVDWTGAPFGKLQFLPKNAEPVTSWSDRDAAFASVTQGIREVANKLTKGYKQKQETTNEENKVDLDLAVKLNQTDVRGNNLGSELNANCRRLGKYLESGNWMEADHETLDLMLRITGSEDWLSDESVNSFPCTDLRTIDTLWTKYSNGRFGFSVQRRVWLECGGAVDFEAEKRLGVRVGWLKEDTRHTPFGTLSDQRLINYSEINFSRDAQIGHLPAVWYIKHFALLDIKALFSRVKNCGL